MNLMPLETHAIIDLAAIEYNLRATRQLVGNRAIMAAVKANAYGHGAVTIANFIQSRQLADALAVATVAEGSELRNAGIKLPILKLSLAFSDELAAAIAADLTLTVADPHSVIAAQTAAAQARCSVPVHLKLDSGMRRIGSTLEHGIALAQLITACPNLKLEGIFTHFPVSDIPEGVEYTRDELQRFCQTVRSITAEVGPIKYVHAANSGAILSQQLGETTMVRPGIMMYGYYPDVQTPRPITLKQAFHLVSAVSFIKTVSAGDSVGYGRTWIAEHDTRIATIRLGYADGFARSLSNRGEVLIRGKRFPIRGRVCMDQLMVEVDESVQIEDEVIAIGRQKDTWITTQEVAAALGTICYEVVCLIPPRVTRVYVK